MNVVWSPEAEDALLALVVAADRFSAGSGDRLAGRIRAVVESLEQFPRLGRVVPEYGTQFLREVLLPPYRVIYEIFPDRCQIVAIRHSAELLRAEEDD